MHLPVIFRPTSPDHCPKPTQGTSGSAGYDVVVNPPSPVTIQPGEVEVFDLGYYLEIPEGWYVSLQTRSGLSIKHRIVLANGTEGVIDSDYRESIKVALYNAGTEPYTVHPGDRVAQIIFKPYGVAVWSNPTYNENCPGERSGGLGSTGR